MVGLIRHEGRSPWHLTQSHQVLAFAYEADGDADDDPYLRPEPARTR